METSFLTVTIFPTPGSDNPSLCMWQFVKPCPVDLHRHSDLRITQDPNAFGYVLARAPTTSPIKVLACLHLILVTSYQ